jgi:hypothetical protein
MRTLSGNSVRRGGRLLPLLSVALVAVLLAPYGIGVLAEARAAAPTAIRPADTAVFADVFWDGTNVNTAPNPSSAISWTFDNRAYVNFSWAGLALPGVSQAFLVILFLGFPAYTKQQVQTVEPVGEINMTYDLTEFRWYLQGIFEVHAYLENPSGNVLFSQDFYVRVAQPYDIVVATVGLLLLTIAELYMIATVGPRALDKSRGQTPPPKSTTPPEDTSSESTASSTETPPAEGT